MQPKISVLLTAINSENNLKNCLKSIRKNNYNKKYYEIIYVDAGSSDNSLKTAKKFGAKIIVKKNANIPEGRNLGIKNSKGEILAFTDTDCVVDKNWLKEIDLELSKEGVLAVGGPNLIPKAKTWFEKCIGTALNTYFGSLGSISGLIKEKRTAVRSVAANNAAYKREIIKDVGLFDEKLITGEDPDLNLRIRKKGFKIIYSPKIKVWHYRRQTLKKFLKQMYYYGVGRVKLIKKHKIISDILYYMPIFLSAVSILLAIYNFNLFLKTVLIAFLTFFLILFIGIFIKSKDFICSLTGPVFLSLGYLAYFLGYFKEIIKPVKKVV